MENSITKLDRATQMLAEAKTLEDVKKIRDIAEAARVYARAAKLGLEAYNHAAEVKVRAERKAGEMLGQLERNKGGRPNNSLQDVNSYSEYKEVLDDNGINYVTSHRWQQLADMPELVFEQHIEELRGERPITTNGILKEINRDEKLRHRNEMSNSADNILLSEDIQILVGDFRTKSVEIPENSVDIIFTDPPYDDETVPLYEDLAIMAKRVLKPGGSLITYAGHHALPNIFPLMTPYLRFWWTLCLNYAEGPYNRLVGKNIFVEWKPLLWFVKDNRWNNEFVSDKMNAPAPTKMEHDWQQGEVDYYINKLSEPNGIVLDPFLGSGTTLIAALKVGRRGIGIELNSETAKIAKMRIGNELKNI